MTYTYGDVKIGDLIDSEKVTGVFRFWKGPWGGPHTDYVTITVASGGRRTELASHPAGPTDHRLADVNDQDLAKGADAFADHLLPGPPAPGMTWALEALHGVAVEINRRAA